MARSTYIYVAMIGIYPVAAFTVKHEMESWLKRQPYRYSVWRLRDNQAAVSPVLMEI